MTGHVVGARKQTCRRGARRGVGVDAGQIRGRGRAEVAHDVLLRLVACKQRLPGEDVLGEVRVAAGDAGEPAARHPGEHVVTVHELVAVDQVAHVLRVEIDAAGRAAGRRIALLAVRVGGDDGGARSAGLRHRRPRPIVDPDIPAQADGERVDGDVGVHVGIGQLETGNDEQTVVAQRPFGRPIDGVQVRGVVAHTDRVGGRIGGADHMVGDAEHVESPLAVEVDEPIEIERAVAPGAVRVQLAQKWAAGLPGSGGHAPMLPGAGMFRGFETAKRR